MRREEKRKKLNEALVNMLYHHPASPPTQDEEEDKNINLDLNEQADDLEAQSESEGESGSHKLTRAQRKRIKKKKLKQESLRRGNFIGPLFPQSNLAQNAPPPSVRCFDSQKVDVAPDGTSREIAACDTQKRLKQRRMAKRVAKGKLKSSNVEICDRKHAAP